MGDGVTDADEVLTLSVDLSIGMSNVTYRSDTIDFVSDANELGKFEGNFLKASLEL
jgi:hypothetical protein